MATGQSFTWVGGWALGLTVSPVTLIREGQTLKTVFQSH